MLRLLHGSSYVIQALIDGIKCEVDAEFPGRGLLGRFVPLAIVKVLEGALIVYLELVMGCEALNHVVKVGLDDPKLLGLKKIVSFRQLLW